MCPCVSQVSQGFYRKEKAMGYRVAKHWKNKSQWRVIWRKYALKDGEYKGKDRHIPEAEYPRLGITKAMTLEEVKAILKKVNTESIIKQRDEKRNLIALRIAAEKEIECIHLPAPFVLKFESEHLATRYIGNDTRLAKILKLWLAAQRIIRTIKITTDQWHRYPEHFYAHFEKKGVSPGYAKNILSTLNMWIDFLGIEQNIHYRPIPAPNQTWKARLATSFEEADGSRASAAITPDQLMKVTFPNQAQWNWVYCTVWAGIRPNEATALLNKKKTRVKYEGKTPILEVYQTKLKNVPKVEDRWKRIPLFLPEQVLILAMIESGEIEEPLSKIMQDRFGEGHTLYAGRKGFHELMVTHYGQPELEVVRWLGHRSLDMAMKHYAKKDAVRWIPVKPATKVS